MNDYAKISYLVIDVDDTMTEQTIFRDIIYHLLQARSEWDNAIRQVYGLENILHNEKNK